MPERLLPELLFSDRWSRGTKTLTTRLYSTWNLQKLSSWKVSTDSMIFRVMKSHTNEHTVRGRPTLKDIKRFRNGSVCNASLRRDQFTSEHFEWIYQESCYTSHQPGLSTLQLNKNNLQKRHRMIVNQVESQNELKNVWATRAERLENLFTNVSVRVHLSNRFQEMQSKAEELKHIDSIEFRTT